MKYSIAFFSGLLFFISCNSRKLPPSISDRLRQCDTQSVFLPIVRSEKLLEFFPEKVFQKYYEKVSHDFDINKDNGLFFKEFSSFYDKIKDTITVLNVIDNWCATSKFIDSLGNVNPEYPPEAILFYTDETKFIVNGFLTHPGQGWFSLSSYQLYELNIAFLNYVDKLTTSEKEELFLHLKQTPHRLAGLGHGR